MLLLCQLFINVRIFRRKMKVEKRKAITEILTVKSNGEIPVYIPFANGERIQSVSVDKSGVVATLRAVEGNAELTGITSQKGGQNVSLGNAQTVCLIIETKQEAEFELVTIK